MLDGTKSLLATKCRKLLDLPVVQNFSNAFAARYIHAFQKFARRSISVSAATKRKKSTTYKIFKFAGLLNVRRCNYLTLFAPGEWVFEYDPDEYAADLNPGYGPCAGKITDPHVKPGPYVEWVDGKNPGPVQCCHLVKAPNLGDVV